MSDKRLIEVAFPLKQASIDSVHEKTVRHGHISTLHIWPARRPLAASRAALIATLLPDPGDKETFTRCKLDLADRERHAEIYRLHRDLIALRKREPLIGTAQPGTYDGAVLSQNALALRYFGTAQDDRLLIVNLGIALHLDPSPEPLLAPLEGCEWELVWSSEDPRYGGTGTPPLESVEDNWRIPAHAAALLMPKPISQTP